MWRRVALAGPEPVDSRGSLPRVEIQKMNTNAGVKIYAVAKETDGTKKDWLNFIGEQHLQEWTHVYYSKAEDKARIAASIPGYSQLYDIQTFPTLYLLDKDKRIIAKKLTCPQMDEILELKMKGR